MIESSVVYCINPWCSQRQNSAEESVCQACGTPLLIADRFRLLYPLRSLEMDTSTQVFEAIDVPGTIADQPGTHKVLKVLCSQDEKKIELVEREAHILRFLNFPGIPRVFVDDYFTYRPNKFPFDLHCIAIQKIEGQTLEAWSEQEGPISQSLALDWLRQLVEILDRVHQQNHFHRDIKPTNIILKPDGQLVLIDFGAVRDVTTTYLAKVSGPPNQTGFYTDLDVTAVQTIGYTPPEQADGKALPQSDFYALGRTFVHLMTGVHPRKLSTDYDTGELLWREMAPQIDQPVIDFIDELIDLVPGKRPKNTQYILQFLSDRLPLRLKWSWIRRTKVFWSGVIGLTVALGFGLYYGSRSILIEHYFQNALKAVQLQDFDRARSEYERVIKLDSKNVETFNNLASVCHSLNDLDCAIDNYSRAIELNPQRWELHYNLGRVYDDQKQFPLAITNYRRSIELGGAEASQVLSNLSRIKILQKDYPSALELAKQGLDQVQKPKIKAVLLKNLGWAFFEQGRYPEAEQALKQSVELDSERAAPYCLLAQVQEALKQGADANVSWEVCLLLASDLPEVTTWKLQFIQRATATPP